MPASARLDPETGIWIFELSGVVEPKEALDAYQSMRARPDFEPSAPRLWDARRTDATPIIDALTLRRISTETGSEVAHRVAILVAREVDYGLSRMYEAYADGGVQQANTFVFRDYDQAIAWLTGDGPPPA